MDGGEISKREDWGRVKESEIVEKWLCGESLPYWLQWFWIYRVSNLDLVRNSTRMLVKFIWNWIGMWEFVKS